MIRALLTTLLIACALPAQQPKLPDISYDAKAPLGLEETLIKDFGFARLMDLSYQSPRGGRVNGYAVIPTGVVHPAGIVWQHWARATGKACCPKRCCWPAAAPLPS